MKEWIILIIVYILLIGATILLIKKALEEDNE